MFPMQLTNTFSLTEKKYGVVFLFDIVFSWTFDIFDVYFYSQLCVDSYNVTTAPMVTIRSAMNV